MPSVTHRDQTLLFDDTDWENAHGNLDALPRIIAERDAREATEAEAVEKGDVKAVMETRGVNERHARTLTKEAREQSKAERDAQILQLHGDGKNASDFSRDTGIPRTTVNRVIKNLPLERGDQNGSGHMELLNVDRVSTCFTGTFACRNGHPPEPLVNTQVDSETHIATHAFRNLFDCNLKTLDLRPDEIPQHADLLELLSNPSDDHPLINFADNERLRIYYEDDVMTAVSIVAYLNTGIERFLGGKEP